MENRIKLERKLDELRDYPMVIDCREQEEGGEPEGAIGVARKSIKREVLEVLFYETTPLRAAG